MPSLVSEATCSLGSNFPTTKPTNFKHFALWCSIILDYRLPYPAFCEDHSSPLMAMWKAFNDEFYYGIWLAMRGSGKTQDLAILVLMESIFKPNCWTTVLGGSLEQSQNIINYLEILWSKPLMPHHLLVDKVNGRGFQCTNGSWVKALAASPKSVRGPHPQKLRLDEVDEMEPEIYEAALGQPMEAHGIPEQVIVSSTLQHAYGLMAKIVDERHEKDGKLFAWCVNEVTQPRGFWTPEAVERKKKSVSPAMWDSEYLLKRPKMDGSVYDFVTLDRAYNRGVKFASQNYIGNIIDIGLDWGFNVTALHLIVDFKDRFLIWQTHIWENIELTERCEKVVDFCIRYGVKHIYADSNPKDSNITLYKLLKLRRCQTQLVGIQFNKFKTMGTQVTRYLLEKGVLDIASHECKVKLQQYHYKNIELDMVEKVDDHVADALIAWAAPRFDLLPKDGK